MTRYEDFRVYYKILRPLGQSSFAIIYEEKKENSHISKAIKVYQKERVKEFLRKKLNRAPIEDDLQIYFNAFKNEATNMKILQGEKKENKNAVKLDDCFETKDEFAIVMEKCDNNIPCMKYLSYP